MQSFYFFDEKQLPDVDLVGGKGLSLIRMTKLGLHVPYGFIISPRVWKEYTQKKTLSEELKAEIMKRVEEINKKTGLIYGDKKNPLILSARSGSKFSMPGMMESVLDIGITDETINGLSERIGKTAALSSYQQFLYMFGSIVLKIDKKQFDDARRTAPQGGDTISTHEFLIGEYKKIIRAQTSVNLTDVKELLLLSISAVFDSFDNPGAIEYRNITGIPHTIGTAVIIQQMVFGNSNNNAGSAVVFSRDPKTGQRMLTGHYLECVQGEEVVKGLQIPKPVESLPPFLKKTLENAVFLLEKELRNVVDVEVTWENNEDPKKIYILQSRPLKIPPHAYFTVQEGLLKDGIRRYEEILNEVSANIIFNSHSDTFTPPIEKNILYRGSPLHTGYGMGKAVLDVQSAKEALKKGENVVLICTHFDPNDLELLTSTPRLQALVATEGGPSSHMGLILSAFNIPGIIGVNERKGEIKQGDFISVDSEKGRVYSGTGVIIPQKKTAFVDSIATSWIQKYGMDNAWSDFIHPKKMEKIEDEVNFRIEESKQLSSKKARQTYLINTTFDKNILIYTDIIPSNDTKAIMESIAQVKKEGRNVWMRSCYNPDLLTAPYTSVDLTSVPEKDLGDWLNDPKSTLSYSKFGNYAAWKTITNNRVYEMAYALIQHDEKDKLNNAVIADHFVASMRCERGKSTRVIVNISDSDHHLRVLGEKKEENIMSIVIVGNKALSTKIGHVYYVFGKNMFNQEKLVRYTTQSELLMKMEKMGYTPSNEQEFVRGVNKLIENNQLGKRELSELIQKRKWDLIQFVSQTIIYEWWNKYDIATRMWALNKLTGASILEIQGRLSEKHTWIKIYGTKGEEERSLSLKYRRGEKEPVIQSE